jgi:hypothetical protein
MDAWNVCIYVCMYVCMFVCTYHFRLDTTIIVITKQKHTKPSQWTHIISKTNNKIISPEQNLKTNLNLRISQLLFVLHF